MFYASVDLQGFIVRLLAWKRSVFRGNSFRFTPEIRQKVRKRSAPDPRGWGCYSEPMLTWNQLKVLMDAQYYPRDVRRVKEREFLCLKHGEISVMEYAAKFNELSRFTPNQVATKEMRMDHFEQRLRGKAKQIIAGYTYGSFQEMYQKAMKISRIISETEIENGEKDQVKEKFSHEGSNSQGNINFWRFKYGMK